MYKAKKKKLLPWLPFQPLRQRMFRGLELLWLCCNDNFDHLSIARMHLHGVGSNSGSGSRRLGQRVSFLALEKCPSQRREKQHAQRYTHTGTDGDVSFAVTRRCLCGSCVRKVSVAEDGFARGENEGGLVICADGVVVAGFDGVAAGGCLSAGGPVENYSASGAGVVGCCISQSPLNALH